MAAILALRHWVRPESGLSPLTSHLSPEPPPHTSPPPDPKEEHERSATGSRLSVLLAGSGFALLALLVGSLALGGLQRHPAPPLWQVPGGSSDRGKQAIRRYGCGGCHTISGIPEAAGRVGPLLLDFRREAYIVGRLPNVPHYLVIWLQNPQQYEPGSAMPNLGIPESDARDIATYLYGNP